ncbi:nuclear transport factor 2 family protein [Vreelandella titanicae]|uniref:SnoaL-like domain-containing protein n=1 Tax=Vreelandella titanicae BH1 TaxID=1204738 RepID=L9U5Q2_9GAMM|nr:nuclear transport factor 2 family protein [Halomonas titanicae]ELY20230.1 hypothetical protein HALTITAN_3151 [Halomonas titanicae BH1]
MTSDTSPSVETRNPIALKNIDTIRDFFSLYLKDKDRFYSLWVDDQPSVLTPFVSDDVAVCKIGVHSGWTAVKAFWDPIFDEMTGTFDWVVDDFIVGEDPNTIVTKAQSAIDVQTGDTWGNKHLRYNGRYVQIFRFRDGKVESFEEYYDTALLNAQYS